jgi:hypothetical protein
MSYQAYAVTLRPREGITDEQISHFDDWVHKVCDHHLVVTEKRGKERHIHAGLFLKSNTTRSNLNNRILAIKKMDLDLTEKKILRQGTRIMYNTDFITEYCDKQDETEIISQNLPDDIELLEAYFPEKDDKRMSKEFKGSKWYLDCEKLWGEYSYPETEHGVKQFLHRLMYIDRKIEVIDDPRRLAGKTKSLFKFLQKEEVEDETDSEIQKILEASM